MVQFKANVAIILTCKDIVPSATKSKFRDHLTS